MRGTAAAASGIVQESGPLQGVWPLPLWQRQAAFTQQPRRGCRLFRRLHIAVGHHDCPFILGHQSRFLRRAPGVAQCSGGLLSLWQSGRALITKPVSELDKHLTPEDNAAIERMVDEERPGIVARIAAARVSQARRRGALTASWQQVDVALTLLDVRDPVP